MRRIACLTAFLIALISLHRPVLSAPATTTASDDRAVINDEIKTDQDAIKLINTEIAGDDKDAADAEAAAKNPPANLSDSEKAAFVDQKKNDEQTAQDAAKEARERLIEAQKSLDDAKAKLKALDDAAKKTV
jgi:hypothetical protein